MNQFWFAAIYVDMIGVTGNKLAESMETILADDCSPELGEERRAAERLGAPSPENILDLRQERELGPSSTRPVWCCCSPA